MGSPKARVFILPGYAESLVRRLFTVEGYEVVESLDDADIVVFLGGDDLNPSMYGEKPSGAMDWDDNRDAFETSVYNTSKGLFRVGICRGGQLLNVLNGGTLWQDINCHNSGVHSVTDFITKETVLVNSLHHQQIRVTDKAEVIAGTNLATEKDSYSGHWNRSSSNLEDLDVEVAWYPDTKSLMFQPHPQLQIGGPTGNYFIRLLERYYHAA